jgi:hypothetical protein
MTERKAADENMDELLKRALADDLPADVAAVMRERIERFREAKAGGEALAGGRAAAWGWLFRRSVWAAISILLLAAGIVLQGRGSSSPLAERISAVKAQYASQETTRR